MTLRLGLRLALKGNRQVISRQLMIVFSTAVGVCLLLTVISGLNILNNKFNRACWECTTAKTQPSHNMPNDGLLWHFSTDVYQGKTIKTLYVASLGPHAAQIPGVPYIPQPGTYMASPAMTELLRDAPRSELGARYGIVREAGIVGDQALTSPKDLVMVVGRDPQTLKAMDAITVYNVSANTEVANIRMFVRVACAILAAGLLFPILVLIGNATRLSAARREERYAALSLVGASDRQINVFVIIDALVGTLAGVVVGGLSFALIKLVAVNPNASSLPFFVTDFTPQFLGFAAIAIIVPAIAAVAGLLSLRKVHVSPIGISRHLVTKQPTFRRILPFIAGVILFIFSTVQMHQYVNKDLPMEYGVLLFAGFVLIVAGIVVAGPWLTLYLARLLAKRTGRAYTLLATRRLAHDPQTAFRSVSGVIVAVFIAACFAGAAPALFQNNAKRSAGALENVFLVPLVDTASIGLSPEKTQKIVAGLEAIKSVQAYPLYAPSSQPQPKDYTAGGKGHVVISCQALAQLREFGACDTSSKVAKFKSVDAFAYGRVDATIAEGLPKAELTNYVNNPMLYMLVRADNASALELARTYVFVNLPEKTASFPPQTYGEIYAASGKTVDTLRTVINWSVLVTLLIAGCSLTIATLSALVERKRTFTILRLSGASMSTLRKVMLYETIVPLVVFAAMSVTFGYLAAFAMVKGFTPDASLTLPSKTFYLTMAAGLMVSLLIVCSTLPVLRRITTSENARYE